MDWNGTPNSSIDGFSTIQRAIGVVLKWLRKPPRALGHNRDGVFFLGATSPQDAAKWGNSVETKIGILEDLMGI